MKHAFMVCAAVALSAAVPACVIAARNDALAEPAVERGVQAPARDIEGAIAAACKGLSGIERHECVYEIVARERRRSERAVN